MAGKRTGPRPAFSLVSCVDVFCNNSRASIKAIIFVCFSQLINTPQYVMGRR